MYKFAIYAVTFEKINYQPYDFPEGKSAVDFGKEKLNELLKVENLKLFRNKKKERTEYHNKVNISRNGVTLLTICNHGRRKIGTPDFKDIEIDTYPRSQVIIDNRENVTMIAIEDNEAFKNTDIVRDILRDTFNSNVNSVGLKVSIRASLSEDDFWKYLDERVANNEYVTKIVLDFPSINSIAPSQTCGDEKSRERLLALSALVCGSDAASAAITMNAAKDGRLKVNREEINDVVLLLNICLMNGMNKTKVYFQNKHCYKFGKAARAVYNMNEKIISDFTTNAPELFQGEEAATYQMFLWLNDIVNKSSTLKYEEFNESDTEKAGQGSLF